ncbi:MAG: hypothetical protein IKR05_11045 [Prevotella sp.]|nr:hypothetical protein [Prevotella sp.]
MRLGSCICHASEHISLCHDIVYDGACLFISVEVESILQRYVPNHLPYSMPCAVPHLRGCRHSHKCPVAHLWLGYCFMQTFFCGEEPPVVSLKMMAKQSAFHHNIVLENGSLLRDDMSTHPKVAHKVQVSCLVQQMI